MSEKVDDKGVRQDRVAEIEFEPLTHAYKVNGKILPSVSEIMRPMTQEYYGSVDEETLDNARRRGEMVHRAVEMYEKLGVEAPEEIKMYLLAYKKAKKLEGFRPMMLEQKMTNGEFCGTLDCVAMMPDGSIVVIDWKTTSNIVKDLLAVQLAGYKELAEVGGVISKTYVLQLKKDGNYKFVEITPNVMQWTFLKDVFFGRATTITGDALGSGEIEGSRDIADLFDGQFGG